MIMDLAYCVEKIMDKEFIMVDQHTKIKEAVDCIIFSRRDEIILVDEKKEIKGIFTRKDIYKLKTIKDINYDDSICKYASQNIIYINHDDTVRKARDLMIKEEIGRLVVRKGKDVVGILTNNNIRDNFYMKIDELNQMIKEAFHHINEAICICNSKGEVIYWNKSAEKLYGINEKNILGTYVCDSFPNALMKRVFKEKVAIKNIVHEPVKGKSVVLSVVPIFNADKHMIAVVSTDRDITEVVNLSDELQREKEKSQYYESEYRKHLANNHSFSNIIGKSKKIIEAITLSQRVAASSASVLITGESGTGKEVFARAIHDASARKGRLVAVNCSAIPEQLLESELFGYEGGAFTGAIKGGKVGKIELANNGTLFLDEIGDMPMSMQSKLLRVLQDGVISRLGSEKTVKTNFRVIGATNKNLRELIEKNEFRKDLFYRLSVVHIELPPLRDRKEDILELSKYFIKEISENEGIDINKIDESIYDILQDYHWEGNIRELRNVIQRIVVLSDEGYVCKEDIPQYILENCNANYNEFKHNTYDLDEAIKNLEINMLRDAMKISKGNKAEAAKLLNINRSTLYYKLRHYNID